MLKGIYLILSALLLILLFIGFEWLHKKKFAESRELLKKLKESEKNYRVLAEKYEAVVSNIREVIFQLDPNGILLYVNNSWLKLTGYTPEESMGRRIQDFLSEDIKLLIRQSQSKMLSDEYHLLTKCGEQKMVEITVMPLFSTDGDMYGFSGSINDVTERKEQELYVKKSKKYVEELNFELEKLVQQEVYKNRQKDHLLIEQSRLASMGEMIASIGHQWRQPLNSLSLLIQDVSEALEFGEINQQYITRFTKESMVLIQHMSQTINDFRKFYLPNKEKQNFSIAESIEEALSIFSISLNNYNIDVQFEYRGQQKAYGYQNEFSQAVLSILTNARDAFVEKNIKNRTIKIKINENDTSYLTEITDNAGGIDSGLMEKVFDPYFTTKKNGTGLGLYMTKMILENMNGTVSVKNIADGVQFQLIVPKSEH